MTKTRILYIHHGTGIGGAPISLLNLIKRLNKKEYKVKVAFIKGGVAKELFTDHGVESEVIDAPNTWFVHNETGKIQWWYFYRYPKIYREWKETANSIAIKYLIKQRADIIHLNSHALSSWAWAAKKLGYKVVLHNRETIAKGYFGFRRKILQDILEKSVDAIINISNDNKNRLGLSSKSHVVYNFVSIPDIYRPPMQEEDNKKVLYLGGQAFIKGFPTAVGCLNYLGEKIQVQFAGNYNSLKKPDTLKNQIKYWIKLNLFGKLYQPLKRIKEVSNAELLGLLMNPYPFIDKCDILITPFAIEHFSRPAMEAMAYGKPVIGSNVEGMDEIIDHGETGLLIEKNDPKALAEAINYLCTNPAIAQEMGRKGREKAELLFSPDENTAKVESIYRMLMAKKGE